MDLYQLDCFRTVARMEHISNAAQVLHVTQPALSKIVSRVEDYAGAPLFDRVKGKIYLNDCGMAFLKTLDQVFDLIDKGKKEVMDINDQKNNYVRLASSCDSILFMLAEAFFSEHPETRVRYTVMSHEEIETAFLQNSLDFALTTYPVQGKSLEWEPIADEEIFMVVGENSPFYGRKTIAVSELKGVEVMCESSGDLRDKVCECCESVGFSPNIVLESNSGSIVGFNVGLSRAACFMPAHRFMQIQENNFGRQPKKPNQKLCAIRLEMPDCRWTTGLARKPDELMNEGCRIFYEQTMDYFHELNIKMNRFMHEYFGDKLLE